MNFTNKQIENIVNEMFPGMTFYYRDADLPEEIIDKYEHRQILRNGIFLDVSSMGGKLMKNTRFLIASNKAVPLYKINPDVAKWMLHTINVEAYFQVIDVLKENDKTQILLIQIPKEGVALFQSSWINLLDGIVEKGKASFEQKKSLEPIAALQEEQWIKRTEYPIGLNGKNDYFDLLLDPSDDSKQETNSKTEEKEIEETTSNTNKNDKLKKKSGFWSKLFGK